MKESDDVEKPQCFLCGKILANASMKPAKLIEHLKSLHPENASKDLEFFYKEESPVFEIWNINQTWIWYSTKTFG